MHEKFVNENELLQFKVDKSWRNVKTWIDYRVKGKNVYSVKKTDNSWNYYWFE